MTKPKPQLRADEELVMSALCRTYGGTWTYGENPPDAYLLHGDNHKIAVEVSTLVQHMHDGDRAISREGVDDATQKLASELEAQIGMLIPDGFRLLVGLLRTPLRQFSKTKRQLPSVLRNVLSRTEFKPVTSSYSGQFEILGNPIGAFVDYHGDASRPKVETYSISGAADMGENALFALRDRIEVKQRKCQAAFARGPVWLALLNRYWLADAHTYRYAFSRIRIAHSFDAIITVSDDETVEQLYPASVPPRPLS